MLRRVQCGDLVLDPLVLEELLQFAGDVLAPSVRAEEHDTDTTRCPVSISAFAMCLEAIYDFGLKSEAINEDFSGFVVDPCNEVIEVFVCCHTAAYI